MKKLLFILTMFFSLTFTSCETSAQVVYDDGFEYSYYDNECGWPIVIINGSYYYRYWLNNTWAWSLVPEYRIPYLIHYSSPMMWHRPGWTGRPFGGPRVSGPRMGGRPMGAQGIGSRPSGGTHIGGGMPGGGSRGSSSRMTVGGGQRGGSMGGSRIGGTPGGGSRAGSMGGGPRGGRGR